MTNEELYLTGLHLEQYRHATYLPDPYYLEALRRDPGDSRANNAYGLLLMRRGRFDQAETYFRAAIDRLTARNPNPYCSEAYMNLGLCLRYQGREDEAYDAFFKATWTAAEQETSYYHIACIDCKRGDYALALEHVERSLVRNSHNLKARALAGLDPGQPGPRGGSCRLDMRKTCAWMPSTMFPAWSPGTWKAR